MLVLLSTMEKVLRWWPSSLVRLVVKVGAVSVHAPGKNVWFCMLSPWLIWRQHAIVCNMFEGTFPSLVGFDRPLQSC